MVPDVRADHLLLATVRGADRTLRNPLLVTVSSKEVRLGCACLISPMVAGVSSSTVFVGVVVLSAR